MITPSNKDIYRSFVRNLCKPRSISRIINFALFCCAIAAIWLPAAGQSNVSGRFFGVVRDKATQAVLPGATATFKNLRTGSLTTARAGGDGQFSYTPLSPDDYEIEVKADGYAPQTQRQTLTAMQPTPVEPIPFELTRETVAANPPPVTTQPGNTVPQTTPTPAPARAETETINLNPSRGAVFDIRAVQGLPLGGTTLTRTFDELAFLAPGVNPAPQAIGSTVGPGVGGGVGTSGQFSVNGLRSRANNFTVDGSDNNDEDIGVRRQGFFTLVPQPIESVQEFQIITLLAPAQYGRNLGAQVNAISKGGGNEFHGAVYGIGNADFLNARNSFDNAGGNTTTVLQGLQSVFTTSPRLIDVCLDGPAGASCPDASKLRVTNDAGKKDAFSLLQGGFAIGGPISRKHGLFFFASGEGQHLDGTSERHFAVPTVEQRGIFGTGAEGYIGASAVDPGPNCDFNTGENCNLVPLFPTALRSEAIYSLFPLPNDPGGIYGRNTFTKALPIDARGVILSGKVDYDLFRESSNRQTLTVRYNFTDDRRDLTDVGGALFSAIRPLVRTNNLSAFLTGRLTDNLSNEFRFSYGRTRLKFEELRDDFLQPVTSLNASEDTRFLLNARSITNNTIGTCPNQAISCPFSQLVFPSRVDYTSDGINTADTELGYVGQVIIGGFSPLGVDVFNFPQERTNGTYQFADVLRSQFAGGGDHSLAFGTDIRRVYLKSDLPRNSRPLITFYGGQGAPEGNSTNVVFPAVDLVALGASTGFFQSLVLPGRDSKINLSYNELAFFVQDEWRPARKLMLNLGLRYELNTTPREADSKIEETFGMPVPSFIGGLEQFINGRTKIYDSDRNNFAPRFGFAYAPTSDTVVRGGFGMFYDQILGAVVSQSRNVFPTFTTANLGGGDLSTNSLVDPKTGDPLASRFTFFNPVFAVFDPVTGALCNSNDIAFYGSADPRVNCVSSRSIPLIQPGTLNTINPVLIQRGLLQAALSDLYSLFPFDCLDSSKCSGSIGVTLPARKLNTPFSYQYSVGVEQRLFGSTFLSVAYVGTQGRNLLRFTTPNLGSNYFAGIGLVAYDVNCELAQDTSVCEPLASGSTFSPRTPVSTIGSVSQFETTGRSRYNSLQVEVRGRLARSFQVRTNYVYGSVKDDVSDVFDLAGAFALPQNSLTLAGEYAPANFDVRHRFTYNFIYSTPELRNASSFIRYVLGGWQIAGTGKFNTGQPFTVNTTIDVNQDGNLTDRLNNTSLITVTNDRRQPLVLKPNSNIFGMLAPFGRDGSVPRNSFRAGSILELDMAFARRFSFRETHAVELRADIFNFINRANFGVPVRFLEFPGFGKAVDTVTPGRRIQFMARYWF